MPYVYQIHDTDPTPGLKALESKKHQMSFFVEFSQPTNVQPVDSTNVVVAFYVNVKAEMFVEAYRFESEVHEKVVPQTFNLQHLYQIMQRKDKLHPFIDEILNTNVKAK